MTSTRKGLMLGVWLLAVLWATVWAEFDSGLDREWDVWKTTHQKKYQNEVVEMFRRALWEENLNHINAHNLEASLGRHTYTLGLNHLSDLTKEEMLILYATLRLPKDFKITPTPLQDRNEILPDSVDWRESGLVTSVKDQGECGSCWACSTVGALEGLWAKTTGKLVDLSPQNLVDCARLKYFNFGCLGGKMHRALNFVIDNHGIASEASYPYTAEYSDCGYNASIRAANCSSYHFVSEDELSLKEASATIGPIGVAIVVIDDLIQYKSVSGVFSSPNCTEDLNHAVLLVGYGTDDTSGLDYWLIKNSWGEDWGENGYLRLARNKNQMCGISQYAVYPQ